MSNMIKGIMSWDKKYRVTRVITRPTEVITLFINSFDTRAEAKRYTEYHPQHAYRIDLNKKESN